MFYLLLLLLIVAAVTVFGLTGFGFGQLAQAGVRHTGEATLLRAVAALTGAAALAMYTWGLLIVTGAVMTAEDGGTDSSPPQSCRTAGWWERHRQGIEITDYSVHFVPLGFVCETSDGGSYDNGDVPGYVNPATFALALTSAAGAVGARRLPERGAGADGGRPKGQPDGGQPSEAGSPRPNSGA
ncbi:hypothetical protein ACGFNV_41115 [Streptomyces sp. NPDC048751]|uniref:hypothetical protein n=1 Tax=Streptomyces sp. NPDC048751 TaxID=3365591 RepID=UPI003716C224